MADDFDVEAMLEAPYRKVGGRPEVFVFLFIFCWHLYELVQPKWKYVSLFTLMLFQLVVDIILMMNKKGEIVKIAPYPCMSAVWELKPLSCEQNKKAL